MNEQRWFRIIRIQKPRYCDECNRLMLKNTRYFKITRNKGKLKILCSHCFKELYFDNNLLNDQELLQLLNYIYFGTNQVLDNFEWLKRYSEKLKTPLIDSILA